MGNGTKVPPGSSPEPQAPQEPGTQKPPEPQVPDEYKGKSAEELIKLVEEAKSEADLKAKRIAELQSDVDYYDSLRQRQIPQQGFAQELPRQEPQLPWDYEKPVESVSAIAEAVWQKREAERQAKENMQKAYEAQAGYGEGRRQAFKQNPRIFEGVEKDVERAIYESYRTGIIPVHELRNPEAWVRAAQLVHLRDGNYDRLRPTIEPVKATQTEIPPGTRPKEMGTSRNVELDHSDREVQQMLDQYGLSKEEAEEIVKGEQELIEKGGTKEIVRRARR